MENTHNFNHKVLQKCPYHQMLSAQYIEKTKHENTGDWGEIDETDEAGTDPDRNEKNGSDNPSNAGSGRKTNT
ncbi:hypothetical protein [Flavobacterium sp. SORGH_AS_0622]|uniref:hypothetical protein n=1 Tax=Flavobacterium sp. SORGH_AS_0622 TaxID=3041772 RepID=UPI0027855C87|nr:hypothetical protein [Flavobacterium sp. SORGH_AS_0622]MDQ1165645.1 hypothetical protein [Flavobacterium sp. SORGH_AS_0622]